MKPSEELRAMAREIERVGFSVNLGFGDEPCCFVGAHDRAVNEGDRVANELLHLVLPLDCLCSFCLNNAGFNAPDGNALMTADAAAMCEMAADIWETRGQ